MHPTQQQLAAIRDKVEKGQRLSFEDGMVLEEKADLFFLSQMAHLVRTRKNGNIAYYNVNVHLNPTNVCVYRCSFCAFRANMNDDRAYVMSDEQILRRADEASQRGATEMHIVGGLHNKKPFEWYKHILEIVHQNHPELHLKAYTAVEWDWFQRLTGRTIPDLLREFRDAGLGSLPGGGAEIFHEDVRNQICEHKADTDKWLECHREAHKLGIRSNATMLYGHLEKAYHRIDHLIRLRDLQDETGGFQTFIPLAFHPENNRLSHIPRPSGIMDLRTMAIGRLMLDNFPHVKAYWVMLGIKTAQIALWHGADDIDGTVVHEKIYHDAGSDSPQEMTVAELTHLIREAGFQPVERDTLYHEVRRDPAKQKAWKRGMALPVMS